MAANSSGFDDYRSCSHEMIAANSLWLSGVTT